MKIQNVSSFYFEKGTAKKPHIFHVFKGPLFRNGCPIDMNVDVF